MAQNICDKMAAVSIVIVGDSKCGKTKLIKKLPKDPFQRLVNTQNFVLKFYEYFDNLSYSKKIKII